MRHSDHTNFFATLLLGISTFAVVFSYMVSVQFLQLPEPAQVLSLTSSSRTLISYFAIGAPYADDRKGLVYVYPADRIDNEPIATLSNPIPQNIFFGSTVAVGDYNADGYDDVAVGSSRGLSSTPLVHVFSGKDFSLLYSLADTFDVVSVFSLHDVNHDGVDDFAVSSRDPASVSSISNASFVSLYSGTGELLGTAFPSSFGFYDSGFGISVAAGDLDHDGALELFIGAPYERNALGVAVGSVYAYRLSSDGLLSLPRFPLYGDSEGELFGTAVAFGNLLTPHEGVLLVGSPRFGVRSSREPGFVSAYALFYNRMARVARYYGVRSGDHYGQGIAVVDDMNLDGDDDFIVSAPYHDSTRIHASNAGAVYLLSLSESNGNSHELGFWEGEYSEKYFGSSLAVLGNVGRRNFSAVGIGSPFLNNGVVAVLGYNRFLGAPSLLYSLSSPQLVSSDERFGASLSGQLP